MPPAFSCAAALNPLFTVDGVENLIDEINVNLNINLSFDNVDDVSITKFSSIFTECFNYYDNLYKSRLREEITQPKTKDSFTNKILELASRKKARTSSSLNELGLYTKTQFRDFMTAEEIKNFDILKWWKDKVNTYPILACMTRDLLTIQASTVVSESAFSLSDRILNKRRSRLNEESLELCICYNDYLDATKRKQYISALEESSEEIEEEMDNLHL
ncbi:hypothetical protein KSP39_PZI012569 [Platanthera zijinensis]|uniref:HAT C-terminal dimerisation domain-containing protein n=1 Tax=Platanthera zijinensis TaxID=2320716 RepID=A0AAP0BEL3_9ASPA